MDKSQCTILSGISLFTSALWLSVCGIILCACSPAHTTTSGPLCAMYGRSGRCCAPRRAATIVRPSRNASRMPPCRAGSDVVQATPISVSPAALEHLKKLRDSKPDSDLLLRVGVRSGGCSGMSYAMDFEQRANVSQDDAGVCITHDSIVRCHCAALKSMGVELHGEKPGTYAVMEYDGFQLVCDPQSLLYLFGMQLDFSDALVGGGFQFHNPNAESTCGCGKSFGV